MKEAVIHKNIPMYHKLKNILREKIEANEWPADSLIPSEAKLCEDYHLSRMTVRQALACLENEGLLMRIQGKGTYVINQQDTQHTLRYDDFGLNVSAKGQDAVNEILNFEVISASPGIAKKLKISENEDVYEIIRLKRFAGEPVLLTTAYLPLKRFSNLTRKDLEANNLYALFESQFNIKIDHCQDKIEAVVPDDYEIKVLSIKKEQPVILLSRITFDSKQEPIEYAKGIIVTTRCDYTRSN